MNAKGSPAFKKLTEVVPAVNLTSDAVPASCATTITPACLQAIYGVPTTAATQSSNTLAVSGYIDQWANEADLKVCVVLCPPSPLPHLTVSLNNLTSVI